MLSGSEITTILADILIRIEQRKRSYTSTFSCTGAAPRICFTRS